MKKDNILKLRQELLVLKTLNIKPNYSELSRLYGCDRRTVQKYNNGYSKENLTRDKTSKLDKYKEDIKNKLELPGATISGTYQYFKSEEEIGTYSNFYKYIKKEKLKPNKNNKVHLRFETEYGKQLQFDWKEDIKMISKNGELFEFNIFSAVKTFEYIGGVPQELLTDNMSSIVNTETHKFHKEFIAFAKDMNTFAKNCKPRHPYTKGKDESANRFMSWLIPYNHEFEDEKELIEIIKKINIEVNKQVNSTIGVAPIMLFEKEKEYLKPLPTTEIIKQYSKESIRVKITNESLFYYKGKRYSVPNKFINTHLDLKEDNNKLYVYYNKEIVTIHEISEKNINYKKEHYVEGLANILKNKEQSEIEELAENNLKQLDRLCEV